MIPTTDNQVQRKFLSNVTRAATAIQYPRCCETPIARAFGWYWSMTKKVENLTEDLHQRGQVFDVWETPQFHAVEWLVGKEKIPFPPSMDAALHGVFCRILAIETLCRNPLLHGDIIATIERIDAASEKIVSASEDLCAVHRDVIDFFYDQPEKIASIIGDLSHGQEFLAFSLGQMKGVLAAQMQHQGEIYEMFTGKKLNRDGRPSNWVARFVTMQAADIYRTAFSGPIAPFAGRPSFKSFLDRFAQGIPDAERADKRALARQIWNGGYEGTPFAPIE